MDRYRFDQLVRDHLPQLQRLAVRLAGRLDRAQDLVQEAMLRAARTWQSLRNPAAFKTWISRIVVNAWRDELRRTPPPRPLDQEPTDLAQPRPADRAAARELGEIVAGHVSSLPPRQREVIVLIAYESHSTAEAAAVLEISEQNVRTTLHLAREKLREQLAAYLEDAPSRPHTVLPETT